MSSEPSERAPSDKAKAWVERYLYGEQVENNGYSGRWPENGLADSFDAGFVDGEKKGTAAGYLAALRREREIITTFVNNLAQEPGGGMWRYHRDRLDIRIREAEENANG